MPGKGPERETEPETTYTQFMTRYVTEARAIGAQPILLTSLTRRRFKEGRIDSDLVAYADAVKRLAAQLHVPLIDLHRLSIALIDSMGQRKSDDLGKMKPDGKGGEVMDYTHLGEKGSEVIGPAGCRGTAHGRSGTGSLRRFFITPVTLLHSDKSQINLRLRLRWFRNG